MAQKPSIHDTQDFANLTDALIPSNIYLNSWSPSDLPKSSDIQPFPFDSNIRAPGLGGVLPPQNTTGNSMSFPDTNMTNHPALSANSLQPYPTVTHDQDRGIGNSAPSSRSEIIESKARAVSVKDPLANLKMRAKESVKAKRSQSIRSASNDSKTEPTNVLSPKLAHKGESETAVQAQEMVSKSYLCNGAVHASSFSSSEPLLKAHNRSAKATSAELEDLLAEGRAAASLPNTTPANEMQRRRGEFPTQCERDVSELGEIRDHSSGCEHESVNHQAQMKTEHFPADEIDEIDVWLAMTGYYDKPYRDKVLSRHKRLKEIEDEKCRLLEEEQEDQRCRAQFHSTKPLYASHRPNPPVATISPPSPTAKQDLGLRIKDSAIKTTVTPRKTVSDDDAPVKRRIEGETTDAEALHQSKVARTEVHHGTPPRTHRASPARRSDRSVSPGNKGKQQAAPSRRDSPRSGDGYDRWPPSRDVEDRSLEECTRRNDYRDRYDQRRDSGFGTSHPAKPDLQAGRVRFFLLKSWNYENIAMAQREGTWATQMKNEDVFVEAFQTCRHVIFFFSANHSKAFQGYARMQGLPGERGVVEPSWVKNLHWPTTAPFRIRWIVKEETPYRAVGNLRNPLNENLAVFVGRDGQEIPEKIGLQLSEIIDDDTSYRADFRR